MPEYLPTQPSEEELERFAECAKLVLSAPLDVGFRAQELSKFAASQSDNFPKMHAYYKFHGYPLILPGVKGDSAV